MIFLLRMLTAILLISSLFFLPWGLVFIGIILAFALFAWYFEGLLIGLGMAILGDVAFWKIFLILTPAILLEESIKTRLNFSKPAFARLWLWFIGVLVWAAAFFIFI